MLTPMDIEKKTFESAFKGYDKKDVDAFLETVLADYEKLYRENSSLKSKNEALAEQVDTYKKTENAISETLKAAQKTCEEMKANASEKANNLINEAELKAKRAIADANDAVAKCELQLNALKREIHSYKVKAVANLNAQIELIEDLECNAPEPVTPDEASNKDFKIDFSSRNVDFSITEDDNNDE